jgi:hypothetical protein
MTDQKRCGDQHELFDLLHRHLIKQFGCHTAILYGSRARGDWDAESDIDVIAFRDTGTGGHVAHRWQNLFLDLFLYPTGTTPTADWVRLHGGKILFQRGSEGDKVLSSVEDMVDAGPERLSDGEMQTRRLWAEKMLIRAEKCDPEGDYRRHWLLMSLLEDYFMLRGQWYPGARRSLALLHRDRPEAFAILRKAFGPSASIEDVRAAVAIVIGTED